ncbi:CAP domain-containing protein [Geobacter sp. DSM 9736]|uniref:CAP domain-containing protein n=1 Tax=Geobacter sp. DSM 9736 TaxID=1277350 RepID=UPI000B50F174|nr:CAP domain-containing protein [Geobacter sp. DSM 9736]SNB48017.1 Cysteine-rich secretory protein family protein [Geobacter sp. DSM 9736]
MPLHRYIQAFALFLISAANPAYADLATEVFKELNLARTAPVEYAQFIEKFRRSFHGKRYKLNGGTYVATEEGTAAVDEASRFLKRQDPLPALFWSDGLARAAADLVREQSGSGSTGHGSRGGFRSRIERHGDWTGYIGENVGYGPDTARLMVMQLIIDDGVPARGHRRNIFKREFRAAGVACGTHPQFRTMCAMDFATGFSSR